MYICLADEQKEETGHKCIEYFINNILIQSILQISEGMNNYKENVYSFIEKIVILFPNEAIFDENFVMVLNFLFKKNTPLILPIALALSEKIVETQEIAAFYTNEETPLVDLIFEFILSAGKQGEFARVAFINLLAIESNVILEYIIVKKYLDRYEENLTFYYDNLQDFYVPVDSSFLNLHLSVLEIVYKKCGKHGYICDSKFKLDFDCHKNINAQIRYIGDIITSNNSDCILLKIIDSCFRFKNIDTCLAQKELVICIIDLMKLILFTKPYLLTAYLNKSEIMNCSAFRINSYMEEILESFGDIEINLYGICEKLKHVKKHNDGNVGCNTNAFDIVDLLVEHKIYDFELFFLIFKTSKNSFFGIFEKLIKLIEDLQLDKKEMIRLWYCFSC